MYVCVCNSNMYMLHVTRVICHVSCVMYVLARCAWVYMWYIVVVHATQGICCILMRDVCADAMHDARLVHGMCYSRD